MSEQTKAVASIDIQMTVKVNRQLLIDLIISAIEGGRFGIEYWCPKIRLRVPQEGFDPAIDVVKAERRQGEVWNEYIARNVVEGGTLTFFEDPEDGRGGEDAYNPRTLTRENLIGAVGKFIAERGASGGADFDKETGLTDYDFDAPDADVILQLALLGEVVYG